MTQNKPLNDVILTFYPIWLKDYFSKRLHLLYYTRYI
jgi:hypothetical protein